MPLTLTGPRLVLRDFTLDDWPSVYAYASRPEASRFQAWEPNSPGDSQVYVAGAVAAARDDPRTLFRLAVVLSTQATVVGAGDLKIHSQQFRIGEIAYIIHPDYWGHRYATEVARLLLEFGFASLGLHRISGTCDPRNIASARVLERVGMQYEGRLRETLLIRDGWRDSSLYSILEHEWRAGGSPSASHCV
jgi:[ribosomal protein S5]-alanine N-acetyltransferase